MRQISRTTNEPQRAATEVMITTPTLAAPSAQRRARRRAAVTCVMRTAMTRPTSTVALATTRHTTRREVTGGGATTSGETGGRRSSGRACSGFRKCASSIRLDFFCCVGGGAASLGGSCWSGPLAAEKFTGRSNRPPRDVRLVALGCSCVRNTNTHARTTPNAQKTCN